MILALPARAKLNLDLEVLRRRDDGYHDLRTTFQAIELHDLLEIASASETSFTSTGFEVDVQDNSVLNAQKALEQEAGRKLPARIHLHKRIPPGSGMGGASSDAAATLKGLQMMFSLRANLKPIAEQLGADVAFFLTGGRARAEGRGEKLTTLADGQTEWFAIAWPGFALATGDVYSRWDEVGGDGPNQLRRAAESHEPRLLQFVSRLRGDWRMTGSGSAFFRAAPTRAEAEDAIADLDCWTVVTSAVPAGA